MKKVAEWLDGRHPAMPGELRRAVDAALAGATESGEPNGNGGAGDVVDLLANGALATLRRVARAPSDRSTAADLLAADALLTYACEAAAEAGPARLERLTRELDHARFASLLEPAAS